MNETEDTEDQLTDVINRYKSHPDIKKIKATTLVSKKNLSELLLKILKILKIFLLTKLLEMEFL